MLSPNTPMTGRTELFVEVEVRDHDVGLWSIWRSTGGLHAVDLNDLFQEAIDAGFDDIRASVHNTGWPGE